MTEKYTQYSSGPSSWVEFNGNNTVYVSEDADWDSLQELIKDANRGARMTRIENSQYTKQLAEQLISDIDEIRSLPTRNKGLFKFKRACTYKVDGLRILAEEIKNNSDSEILTEVGASIDQSQRMDYKDCYEAVMMVVNECKKELGIGDSDCLVTAVKILSRNK